jgi:hypothetical protein
MVCNKNITLQNTENCGKENAGLHFPANIFLTNVGESGKFKVRKVSKDIEQFIYSF